MLLGRLQELTICDDNVVYDDRGWSEPPRYIMADAHCVLSKMSFVTIGLSQLLSWAPDLSSDYGHSRQT